MQINKAMTEYLMKLKIFLKNNIILILILIYFIRFAIPQGTRGFSLTFFFYYFTLYIVVGGLILVGIIGIIALFQSYKKNSLLSSKHKSLLIIATFGLILFGISLISQYFYDHKKFDPILWKDTTASLMWDSNLLTLRQRMTNDLTKNILPGLKKTEAESLLGLPNDTWESDEGGINFLYVLGPERGFGVDYECLLIHFNEKDYYQSHETFGNCG